ncbi:MAG: NAD(P)H-dependent oxidoreductase subunit E [Cyclobacteriaceae bacterium]|nr:NAD(P)H-dependent oxidoreductase subunit E [Cyclobacteriaceae bacterium]
MRTDAAQKFFSIEPDRSRLLSELWDRQLSDRYITDEVIQQLAGKYNVSEIEIEGVVTFYHFFHRKPAGKHTIYINNSIVAELKGYQRIREAFEQETGARIGYTDPSGTFGLFETPCIGLSDQEPAALIDFYPFTNLNALKIKDIIRKLKEGKTAAEICDAPDDHIRFLPANQHTLFFAPYVRGVAVNKLKDFNSEGIIEQLRISELAGRGGAFFPTWKKWESCRKENSPDKFIICNADEGEPGTFKDRVLLNNQPGSVLEGMIIAAFAVGADYGVIYLRGEYRWLKKKLEEEIEHFYAEGLLGKNVAGIDGFNIDIRLEIGAGAYVCGEETALLESMEGKRGEPRTKWFYPVQKGYLQLPTVVNNVETFVAVARLIQVGSFEYQKRGIPGSNGTKLISISGDCNKPGIYEIEWGMTVAELLDHCEAIDPFYIQVSGPSGEVISIKEKYRRISMLDLLAQKDIRCGGSFMIFNSKRDIVNILMNFSEFFKHESCGVCTPCRAGNFIIQRKLERLKNGLADSSDVLELKSWGQILRTTSRCGLGRTSTNSIIQALEKFEDYFAQRFLSSSTGYRKFDEHHAVEEYERYKP